MNNEKISLQILRVFATILILTCHLVQESSNPYITMTAQFFNVGVSVFVIISGYIYGKKKILDNYTYKEWIIKRAKRILVPFYIFITSLVMFNILRYNSINILKYIVYILNLQAFLGYMNGAEHLWYLSIAMIYYIITPILDFNRNKLTKSRVKILLSVYFIIHIIISYINKQIGIYTGYIGVYILSYTLAIYCNKEVKTKNVIALLFIMIASAVIRIIGRTLFDGSVLYDVLIVSYTQAIIGMCMLFISLYIGKKIKNDYFIKVISHFDSISYEIYIVHYMFIVGPISVMHKSSSFIIDTILVLVITYIFARILNILSKNVFNILETLKYKCFDSEYNKI